MLILQIVVLWEMDTGCDEVIQAAQCALAASHRDLNQCYCALRGQVFMKYSRHVDVAVTQRNFH